jgi:hypothetical protein
MRNLYFAFCALALVASSAMAEQKAGGTVLTGEAAIEIARAVAVARYGEAVIQREEPLTAKLDERNNWIVWGTMPQDSLGGVVEVEIARRDGRVLRMGHGQ